MCQESKVIPETPECCSKQVSLGTGLTLLICWLKCLIVFDSLVAIASSTSFFFRRSNSNPHCCSWNINEQHVRYALCAKFAWMKAWNVGFDTYYIYYTVFEAFLCSELWLKVWIDHCCQASGKESALSRSFLMTWSASWSWLISGHGRFAKERLEWPPPCFFFLSWLLHGKVVRWERSAEMEESLYSGKGFTQCGG